MGKPTSVQPLAPGTTIERYTIVCVLGVGACGIAYLVKDEDLERKMLLKEHAPQGLCCRDAATGVLRPLPGSEAAYIKSLSDFLQEALVLSKLRLSAVPEVYEVFEGIGTAFLALSYTEGVSLPLWLGEDASRRSLLPLALAAALRALAKLHRCGVRHRDIKPGHIILDHAGKVSFIDFGAACAAGTRDACEPPPAFTPPYSPPEQGVPELECAAGDLYSLAASFYEVTLGEKPPTAPERMEGKKRLQPLARVEFLRAEFPLAYLATLDRALLLEPRERFTTAEQWLAELLPTGASRPRASRAAWPWAAVGAGALGLCGLFFISGEEKPPPAQLPEPEVRRALFAEQQVVYETPGGVFCSEGGQAPAWAGVCVRVDLVGAENLSEAHLHPVAAMAWAASRVPSCSPEQLVLVLTDAEGHEIARSAPHRYDAATRTLSFDFAPASEQSTPGAFMARPFCALPAGWRACVRQPLEPAQRHGTPPEPPLRAQRAVFHIRKNASALGEPSC